MKKRFEEGPVAVLFLKPTGEMQLGPFLMKWIAYTLVVSAIVGYVALAVFDDALSGGNEDGRISSADEIFAQLGLWRDANHNGVSEPDEMLTLTAVGLEWIDLDYSESSRVDRHGNEFRYRSSSGWVGGRTRRIWNVFLLAQ